MFELLFSFSYLRTNLKLFKEEFQTALKDKMIQFAVPHRLKRMRAMFPVPSLDRLVKTSKSTNDAHSRRAEPTPPGTIHRMLRIFLGDPWDEYQYLYHLGQDMVAIRKASYFRLVNIRQYHSSDVLEQSRLLSRIESPNIAIVYDLYCDDDKIFQVTEHLDISLSQLEIQKYELEEWEMATIIAEVKATSLTEDVVTYGPRFSKVLLISPH